MRLLLNFVSLRSGMSQKLSQSPTKSIVVSWPCNARWYQPSVGSRGKTKKKERRSKLNQARTSLTRFGVMKFHCGMTSALTSLAKSLTVTQKSRHCQCHFRTWGQARVRIGTPTVPDAQSTVGDVRDRVEDDEPVVLAHVVGVRPVSDCSGTCMYMCIYAHEDVSRVLPNIPAGLVGFHALR